MYSQHAKVFGMHGLTYHGLRTQLVGTPIHELFHHPWPWARHFPITKPFFPFPSPVHGGLTVVGLTVPPSGVSNGRVIGVCVHEFDVGRGYRWMHKYLLTGIEYCRCWRTYPWISTSWWYSSIGVWWICQGERIYEFLYGPGHTIPFQTILMLRGFYLGIKTLRAWYTLHERYCKKQECCQIPILSIVSFGVLMVVCNERAHNTASWTNEILLMDITMVDTNPTHVCTWSIICHVA